MEMLLFDWPKQTYAAERLTGSIKGWDWQNHLTDFLRNLYIFVGVERRQMAAGKFRVLRLSSSIAICVLNRIPAVGLQFQHKDSIDFLLNLWLFVVRIKNKWEIFRWSNQSVVVRNCQILTGPGIPPWTTISIGTSLTLYFFISEYVCHFKN